jgi:hypothetical protein
MQQQETPRINLATFIRDALSGAIGNERYPSSAKEAGDFVERLLAEKARRPLSYNERVDVYVAAGGEWNRREQAQRAEDERRRGEWLADYQQGAA